MVMAALPNTILLAVSAIGLAVLIGIPIGCYAAVRPGSLLDQALAIVSVGLVATPSYVVAILLLYFFSVRLGWFPVLGAGDAGDSSTSCIIWCCRPWRSPSAGSATSRGWCARRCSKCWASPISAPRAPMASPKRRVVMKYALKLACIPTVAILGVGIGELMGGAVFVEIIFNRPGLGSLIFDAIKNRNYPIVQGGMLVVVAIFVLTNLLVDLVLCLARPAHPRESSAARAPGAAPDARHPAARLAQPERPARTGRHADRRARRAGGAADRHAFAEPDRRRRAACRRLRPSHLLGADHLGRDLYSRGLFGTRIAIGVALAVTATALVLGILLGVTAAYAPVAGRARHPRACSTSSARTRA